MDVCKLVLAPPINNSGYFSIISGLFRSLSLFLLTFSHSKRSKYNASAHRLITYVKVYWKHVGLLSQGSVVDSECWNCELSQGVSTLQKFALLNLENPFSLRSLGFKRLSFKPQTIQRSTPGKSLDSIITTRYTIKKITRLH
jgi:hypothetical protein